MPMYSVIEYSSNCSETTRNLWLYCKDEATSFSGGIANDVNSKSFTYKAKLLGNTETQPNRNHVNGIQKNWSNSLLLKYLSNLNITRNAIN